MLGGGTISTRYVVTFDCWAESYATAISTAGAVKTALDASTLKPWRESVSGDEYEPMADVFMESVSYGFWVNS